MSSSSSPAIPHWATWLDSLEGTPEWPQPAETPVERAGRGTAMERGHEIFAWLGTIFPGLGLAIVVAFLGGWIAGFLGTTVLGFTRNPISEVTLAILLGLLIRNTVGLPAVYERGLRLCGREVLRAGIVLLGLRLSLVVVGEIGLIGLPIIVLCIAAALTIVTWINNRLGLPRRLGSLIAVGTGICGVSAIVATAPILKAEEDEVSYSVACITLFGMLALITYPFLAHAIFGDEERLAGLFLGTAIHDTAQVAGAGLVYQDVFAAPAALNAATVTKLVRNLCMVAVIPLVALLYHNASSAGTARRKWNLMQAVPLFVLGFLLLAALRTIGDLGDEAFGLVGRARWKSFLSQADILAAWCLTVAMASVGLGTSLGRIKKLGWKSFCVGLAAALVVGGVSTVLVLLLGAWV